MSQITIDPSVLSVLVLLTCLLCIWMVFFFGRRLQTSAYLRDSLIEGVKQQELRILVRELRDRALEGPLDPGAPPPPGYGPAATVWDAEKYGIVREMFYGEVERGLPSNASEEEEKRHLEEEQKRKEMSKQRLAAFAKWEAEERARFEKLRQEAEVRAAKLAEKKIPSSIDISLLGGGWAFLLEFSTVIVIIFTLLILGILQTLEGKDIATILAAIAGYVLGKASSAAKQPDRPLAADRISAEAAKRAPN